MTSTSSHLHPALSIAAGEARIRPDGPTAASAWPRSDRLTVAAASSLFVICGGHTLVFAFHEWWGPWLAGPFRTAQLPQEAMVQFWALPGGLVVPGALLALLILIEGRRGRTVHAVVGIALGAWGLAGVWMLGPSGFATLLVPAALLLAASVRARRRRGTHLDASPTGATR